MRAFVLLFLLSGAASAQPALVAEASVDQASYAYGEPITFRYTVRNEGTEPTVIWGSSSCTLGFEFDGVDLDRACTTDEHPTWLGPEASVTWEWLLDPAELGLPTESGTQTITGHVYGSCGLTYNEASPCPGHLAVSTSFEAPAYLGGLLAISFYPADADSLDALRQSYNGTVLTSFDYPSGHRYEQWRLEAVALDETVAALDANGIVRYARALRGIPEPTRYRVGTADSPERGSLSAPAPNPTAGTATVALRLDRTEAVTVELLDPLGRRVAVLHDGPLAGGVQHPFEIAAGGLPAGVYVVRVTGASVRQSQRVVVAR